MRRAVTIALMPALLLGGCNLAPPNIAPAPPVPPSWPVGDAYLRQTEVALPALTYRDVFADPKLQALITTALANNRNLAIALANVEAARAQVTVARANLFPTITIGGNATTGRRVAGQQVAPGAGSTGTGTSFGGGNFTTFAADLGLSSYEVDLFGRLRNLTAAARSQSLATEANSRAVRIAIAAEVANTYLQLAADRSLLAVARETAASAERTVTLTRARLTGGIAARIDVRQAETILETARSDIANLTALVEQDRNALQLLLGAEPDPALLPVGIEAVDALLNAPPAGLDSRILLRRPDVVQAEYQLYAANAEIGAARAAFFPTISLTGLLGFASTALGRLFTGDAFNWNAGGGVGLPLFDAGRRQGSLRFTLAQQRAAVANYELVVQTAFRDVADALARRGTVAAQLTAERNRVTAAADTQQLVDARYRIGIASSLDVLDAQRTLYAARQSLIQTRLVAAANTVTLYRVLAGDPLR